MGSDHNSSPQAFGSGELKTWKNNTPSLSCGGQKILQNFNAYTNFGESPLIFTRLSVSSRNKNTYGQTDTYQPETIISHHYHIKN